MNEFLLGGIAVGSWVVSMFFWRYWRSTGDRFFLFFSVSFLIEAINRTDMALNNVWTEAAPFHYIVRLVSYGLILVAIWDKNRSR